MKRVLNIFLIASFLIFVTTLTIFPIEDSDIWYHLALGKWISQNQFRPPQIHHYVWPIEIAETNFEWLTEVGVFQIYKHFGINSLIASKTVIILAYFLLLLVTSARFAVPTVVSVPMMTLGVLASSERFIERLEHIGYFWLVIFIVLIYVFKQKLGKESFVGITKLKFESSRIYLLIFIPIIFLLWINMHGSFALGLIILWAFAVFSIFSGYRGAKLLLAVAIISTFGIFLHPNRIEALRATFDLLPGFFKHTPLIIQKTYEFQSPFSPTHGGQPYVYFFKILLLVYWGAFLIGIYRGKSSIYGFILLTMSSILAFTSARHINIFVISGFLPAVEGLGATRMDANDKRISANERIKRRFWSSGLVLLIYSLILILASVYTIKNGYQLGITYRTFGFGVRQIIPDRAVAFLDEHNIVGNLLNQHEIGAYLNWASYPKRKVFIDGFGLYPDWFFQDYLSMSESPEKMREILDKYQVDYAITLYPETESGKSVPDYLSLDPSWSLVFWDDYYLVFLKRKEKFQPTIEKFGYQYADPLKLSRISFVQRLQKEEGSLLRRRIMGELEATIRHNPKNSRAYNLLGSMMEAEGYWDEAIKNYQNASKVNSAHPLSYLLQAGVFIKRQEFDQARELLKQALKINPSLPGPYLILGQIEEKSENYRNALKYYQKAINRAPNLGTAYFRIGVIYSASIYNKGKARDYLMKAIELGLSEHEAEQAKQILRSL